MDNVPEEIKEIVESQLFQQYYTYTEPICYSDLLLNIMKLIRSKWNSTGSSMNSTNSTTMTNGAGYTINSNQQQQLMQQTNYSSSASGNELNNYSTMATTPTSNATAPRPINIQFRRYTKF